MDLLERAKKDGRTYRKASSANGGEYHGPCPSCGGTDRFHIWPAQGEHGTFWCRSCGIGGDAIEYLMKIEGIHFRDACKEVGKELPEIEEYQAPRFRRPGDPEAFQPRVTTSPAELWIQHAEKFVEWAHQQLVANPDQLAWCAARGLDIEAVKTYRLGWNPGEKGKDLYRAREAWGLETVLKENGKPKKLWLPIGLVIPYHQGGTLHRVRIRRPEGEPRYYLVPGSGTSPMLLGETMKALVIVEAELDAILLHHVAGDLVGAISQGNSTAKPDAVAAVPLQNAIAILVALDSDEAGMNAAVWWKKHYPQAERWPVPAGKDPGDAHKAGVDLRAWVLAGLPLSLQPRSAAVQPPVQHHPQQPDSSVHTITIRDGRQIHITDDRERYQHIYRTGGIVFTSKEMSLVKQTRASADLATLCFIDTKAVFPGAHIIKTGPIPAEP